MPAPSLPSTTADESIQTGFKSIVDSIMMEAAEKCEEIDVKCDEEYQILRRKEISEQGEIIERADKKKRESVLRDDRVYCTKLVNNFRHVLYRLAQLKAKNDIYNDILKAVKLRLSRDRTSRYKKLLENSLTQAMYMLMEPEVYITCRKNDQTLIASTFPSAAQAYEENTKLRVTVGFADKTLPENSSSGGMLVSNKKATISVNCSLDSRVDHVCYLAMPMLVEMLFSGVESMKDSLKRSLQKSITPAAGATTDDPTCRLLEGQSKQPRKSEHSPSPEAHELLQERLGIGTSSINILATPASAPGKQEPDDLQNISHHSEEEHDPNAVSERRATTKSSSPGSPSPSSDPQRKSSTKSPSLGEQGPSDKKK